LRNKTSHLAQQKALSGHKKFIRLILSGSTMLLLLLEDPHCAALDVLSIFKSANAIYLVSGRRPRIIAAVFRHHSRPRFSALPRA
jgi:hypothetical protein